MIADLPPKSKEALIGIKITTAPWTAKKTKMKKNKKKAFQMEKNVIY